jgi:hypothetical protein
MRGGLLNARAELAFATRDAALYGGDVYKPAPQPTEEPAARVCGAVGCSSGWTKPWKSRRRPIFEEEWGCSGRCLETLVRAAVRREVGEGGAAQATDGAHRHRVPLGLVLLAQGWITHPQLQAALAAQKASGQGRIGDWLQQSCGLPEERVTRGLGVQWSCPVLATDGFSPSSMARVMPRRFIREFGLVPLRVAGSALLYLAFQDRMNAAMALALEQMTGIKVESGLLPGSQFEQVRSAVLAAEAIPEKSVAVLDADALNASIVRVLEQRQPVASRLVRVHNYYWMRIWLESGAAKLPTTNEDVEDYLFTIAA